VIVIMCVLGTGFATINAPATASFMAALPPEKAGIGSGGSNASRQVAGALGVGGVGTILAQRFGASLKAELRDALPGNVLIKASDSIGAALGVAHQRRGDTAEQIVAAAQSGFLAGFRLALFVGAGVLVLGALVVLRWLPDRALDDDDRSAPV